MLIPKTKNRKKKASKTSLSSKYIARLPRASKITWELGILFVLLLSVFAPNIVQLMAGIAPLIPAPRAAFVYPLWTGSVDYAVAIVAGQSFNSLTSSKYSVDVWSLFGFSGGMSNANYVAQVGIAPILLAPGVAGAGLSWDENSTLPAAPTVYSASQSYTFIIRWSDDPDDVVLQITRDGAVLPSYSYSGGTVTKNGQYYSVNIPTLRAGDYTYKWAAYKGAEIVQTDVMEYLVLKASLTLVLSTGLEDEEEENIVAPLGSIASLNSAIIEAVRRINRLNISIPVVLQANFSGYMVQIADGINYASYELDTGNPEQLPLRWGTYLVNASTPGNENFSANSSAALFTISAVEFSSIQVSPSSGVAYAQMTYQFSTDCDGFVSTIKFEFDGVERATNRVDNKCTASIANIDAGTHSYRWSANDTSGTWWYTDEYTYDVIKADVSLGLTIDGQPKSAIRNVGNDSMLGITSSVDGKQRTLTILSPTGVSKNATFIVDGEIALSGVFGGPINAPGLWKVTASSEVDLNYDSASLTRWIAVDMANLAAPQLVTAGQSTNSPVYGGTVDVWADWVDDVLIDTIWLETNVSGSWQNSSYTYFGSPSANAIFSIIATALPGTSAAWRIWANDIGGNATATGTFIFTVQIDTIAPMAVNQTQSETIGNTTDGIIGVGDSIELSASCIDETYLKEASLATNESGTWNNVTSISISNTSAIANFTWQNSSIGYGSPVGSKTSVAWKIYCKDYSGNVAETPEMIFTVKVFDTADDDKDGRISDSELALQISAWKAGAISISRLMEIIAAWKAGGY